MIQIIDYGMGNIGSISNMLKIIGIKSCIVSNPSYLSSSYVSILPGVGSFDNAMIKLNRDGWTNTILSNVKKGSPLLGICLGMQILGSFSEEGTLSGLNLIEGKVSRFPNENGLKIPHMGWNSVNEYDISLFEGLSENKFYFVHSYFFSPTNSNDIAGVTKYGIDFVSSIRRENIIGVQFHPEKSHQYGMRLLKNIYSTLDV
jgi:glutamine amidotransferase